MAAPLLMSMLGKQVSKGGLNASGLMSLLMGQKDHVKSALPAGLSGVGSLLGLGNMFNQAVNTGTNFASNVGNTATETVEEGKSMISRLWPVLLLGALALGAYYLWNNGGVDKATDAISNTADAVIDGAENAAETVADVASDAAETVSDVANDVVDATTQAARDALSSISFAAGSAGEKLSNLLSSNSEITENIRFNNLTFETGSAAITGETMSEVDNLAAVLKAYPKTNIEIQGHTDNTGDFAKNVELSKARAEAVKARLVEVGIAGDRVTVKGLGSSEPVASNDTKEGREQNRRIEVKVIS